MTEAPRKPRRGRELFREELPPHRETAPLLDLERLIGPEEEGRRRRGGKRAWTEEREQEPNRERNRNRNRDDRLER